MEDNNKHIELNRYQDGTPSAMRKPTVYTGLHFYRKSDVLVQLTKAFCGRFLPRYGDRTVDQMVQAARSVKQNIVEGLTDGQTAFETEIKLRMHLIFYVPLQRILKKRTYETGI